MILRSTRLSCSLALVALALAPGARAEVATPNGLRAAIEAQHPGVDWVDTATLARWLEAPPGGRPLVLLDVREPAEFAVSQLRGARRVDPGALDMAALSLPRGATIVVYCSVGYRSAALAQRLEAAGYRDVWNLQGGLFQWANEGRPIYRGDQLARQVHPYDAEWGRLLLGRYRAPL